MSEPSFSIIIPVYQSEKYLAQCIESVLSQTYKDFELILVDDGSTDKSSFICDKYAQIDTRVKVVHQKNAGVSNARNYGIDSSKGIWITFIDSDDWVEPDYLENFKIDEDESDLIIQGLEYYDDRNNVFFRQVKVLDCNIDNKNIKSIAEKVNLLGSGYPVAKAYRRSVIGSDIRFDPNISYHEDHIFVLDILLIANHIRLRDSTAYKYRYFHSDTSLSRKKHSWNKLNCASNGMLSAIDRLHDRFLIPNSVYARKTYNFAYSPKISAIFEVFRSHISDKERKYAIKTIIDKKQLNKYYNPLTRKDKLVKGILNYTPYCIQKLFFESYLRYQRIKG